MLGGGIKILFSRVVVVTQLVQRSLPTLEIRGSVPVIGKNSTVSKLSKRRENKEKEARNGPIRKTLLLT